jgi:hypothetical protein
MKTFKVLDFQEADSLTVGSSNKGYINATYGQLIASLGEPTYDEPSGDDKVQVEWVVEFNDEIFTIYDWKTFSREYTENKLMEFNIGGKSYAGDFIDALDSLIKSNVKSLN